MDTNPKQPYVGKGARLVKRPTPIRDNCQLHGQACLFLYSEIMKGWICRECIRAGLLTPDVVKGIKLHYHHYYYYSSEPKINDDDKILRKES